MIVIGVGLASSLVFHCLVKESCQYVQLDNSQTEDPVELRDKLAANLETEQRTIKSWFTLKRFYLVRTIASYIRFKIIKLIREHCTKKKYVVAGF